METILKIMGGFLGVLVPFLFIITLRKGISRSPFEKDQKEKYNRILIGVVSLCTILVWGLSLTEILDYHPGDQIPRFLVPLAVFVPIGLFLLRNPGFRTIVNSTPLSALAGVQTFRFAGAAFLIIVYLKILPQSFQLAGYGDILTGILAVIAGISLGVKSGGPNAKLFFWLLTIVGMVDLLNVAFLLVYYYPIWSDAMPSTESASKFSLVMIPALAAPIAMLLHIYAILKKINLKMSKDQLNLNE